MAGNNFTLAMPPGGRRLIMLPQAGQGIIGAAPSGRLPKPAEKEPSTWDKVQEQADAVELIGRIEEQTTPKIEELKAADNAEGSGDTMAKKGEVALIREEVEVPGIGFNNTDTQHQTSYLSYDPKTGAVNEFHTENADAGTEISITTKDGETTYSTIEGGKLKTATKKADGSYDYSSKMHISEEMVQAMAFSSMMKGGMGM